MVSSVMKLSDFFERFDSAREKLGVIAHSGVIGEPFDELDKLGLRVRAYKILGGGPFPVFQGRKGDVRVLGSWCYIPSKLMGDMRFAEEVYSEYSKQLRMAV